MIKLSKMKTLTLTKMKNSIEKKGLFNIISLRMISQTIGVGSSLIMLYILLMIQFYDSVILTESNFLIRITEIMILVIGILAMFKVMKE